MSYSKEVIIRKYKVLKSFIHFNEGDTVNLVLKLYYSFEEAGGTNSIHDITSSLVGKSYETTLPHKALFDEEFFQQIHNPYSLEEFLKECNISQAKDRSCGLNYDINNAEYGLLKVKNFLVEIWFNKIKTEQALIKYDKNTKYKG